MSTPRPVIVTVKTTEWRVVTDWSVMCVCGHEHYGRMDGSNPALAVQWHLCEADDTECGCSSLRPVPRA